MTEREQGRFDALQDVHAFVSEMRVKSRLKATQIQSQTLTSIIDRLDDMILETQGIAPTDPKMEKA